MSRHPKKPNEPPIYYYQYEVLLTKRAYSQLGFANLVPKAESFVAFAGITNYMMNHWDQWVKLNSSEVKSFTEILRILQISVHKPRDLAYYIGQIIDAKNYKQGSRYDNFREPFSHLVDVSYKIFLGQPSLENLVGFSLAAQIIEVNKNPEENSQIDGQFSSIRFKTLDEPKIADPLDKLLTHKGIDTTFYQNFIHYLQFESEFSPEWKREINSQPPGLRRQLPRS